MSEELARKFHEIYERLAPNFGYETRPETRAFDPTTPNGRLMIAVTDEIEDALRAKLARRDEIIARLKEDAERLVGHAVWVGKFLGMKDCIFCGKRAKGKNEIEHTFLCPITLHRALMKELE